MRLRHIKGAEDEVNISPFCINTDNIPNLSAFFGNNKPLYLELGMGKGSFICEMAKKYPDLSFIGVEKYATVVLKAIKNYIKTFDIDKDADISEQIKNINLRFLCIDVENIDKFFSLHSIDKIYLNFSDPWPKKRHAIRRLTHRNFLSIYEKLLKKGSSIEFKTDNQELFDFSLEEIPFSNFKLEYETHDLHADPILSKDNIETEYEHKFASRGNKICKYKISI